MASVEQTKEALQDHADKMVEKALSAVDAVTAFSTYTITAIGVVAALIGIVGGYAIYVAAREEAKKVASRRVETYIRSQEGSAFVRQMVAEEVRFQLEQKIVMVVPPSPPVPSSVPSSFPQAPAQSGGVP